MPTADLTSLFEPRGVVVVGASATPGKLGHAMAESLANYPGALAFVNARQTPGMHMSIEAAVGAASAPVDLAIMCVPAKMTATALRESAAAGIRSALVCAGGFAEAGGPGVAYAEDVRRAVSETGINLLGPNTSGFFVPGESLFASFVPGVRGLQAGSVAVVAASGGINHVLAFRLQEAGVGLSLGVGLGAGEDVAAPDVLRYLAGDDATSAVILHIETVPDGAALLDAVRSLTRTKPVIALVVGQGAVAEFAASHTGALATSWRTTRAVLAQAGAVLVDDETQAVAAAAALAGGRARASRRPGIGLITGQAGPGLIVADRLSSAGDSLPRLADETLTRLSEHLPPLTYQANPVDTGRPGETFPDVVAAVASDAAIDLLGIYGLTEPVVDLPSAVGGSRRDTGVPVVIAIDGPVAETALVHASAHAAGVPVVSGPTALAVALHALADDARAQARRAASDAPAPERPSLPSRIVRAVDEIQAKDVLDSVGIRTPARHRSAGRADAHAALDALGAAVAVKLVDAAVLHKTELGGVVLGVRSHDELDAALDQLESVGAREFLLEAMAPSGVDLVVGARVDPVFGPIVLLGLGGIAAEVLADVAIRTAPLATAEAESMIDDLQAAALLNGYRGGPTVDRQDLAAVLSMLGDLVSFGIADEVEINPLRVTVEGIVALDAVISPYSREEE